MKTIYLIIQVYQYFDKVSKEVIFADDNIETALKDCKRLQEEEDNESFTYEIKEINLYY